MKAFVGDTVIAESDEALQIEGNYYFPPESINTELLSRTRLITPCYWKGLARYYTVHVGGKELVNAAWYYKRPLPWIKKIQGYVAFDERIGTKP